MCKKLVATILMLAALAFLFAAGPMPQTLVWAAGTCTVVFDSQGGTPVAPITTEIQSTITLPEPPTKTGHRFLSWNSWSNGNAETLSESTIISYDITYYAQWAICSYTVRFVDWDDRLISEETLEYDSSVSRPLNNPTRSDYLFSKWDKPVQAVSGDVTYKAIYIPKPVQKITSTQFKIIPTDHNPLILVPFGTTAAEVLAGVNTPREFTNINNHETGFIPDAQLVRHCDMVDYFAEVRYADDMQVYRISDYVDIALIGDVNVDNRFTEDDRRGLMIHLAGRENLRSYGLICADLDEDGQVTALDLLLIKQKLLGQP